MGFEMLSCLGLLSFSPEARVDHRTTLADPSCCYLGPPTKRGIRKGQDIASLSDTRVASRANSCILEEVGLVLLAVGVIPRHTDKRHGLERR